MERHQVFSAQVRMYVLYVLYCMGTVLYILYCMGTIHTYVRTYMCNLYPALVCYSSHQVLIDFLIVQHCKM